MRHGSVIATFTMAIMVMVWLASLLRVGDVAVVPTDTETEEKRIPAPLNASLGFGKLYYISLPSRTDRQDHMSLAFYVSELTPAELVPGVRGKDIAEKARPVGSEDLTTGALGTWRAHANAWKVYPPFIFDVNGKRIVDGGIETALILEDDVDWHVEIKQQFYLVSKALKTWRSKINDVTYDRPYGIQWDVFMVGQYAEQRFNKSEEDYYIYPDRTVLPRKDQPIADQLHLEDLDVPEGHRVLSRCKGTTGMQGYAVTREGAARLLYLIGVNKLDNPVDVELMWNCYYRRLRCIEVSPALIGLYVTKGHASKISDNNPPDWVPEKNNPIGPWSVKATMNYRLDPYNGAKVRAFNQQHDLELQV